MIPFFSTGRSFTGLGRQARWAAPTSRSSSACRSPASSTGCCAARSTSRRRRAVADASEAAELEELADASTAAAASERDAYALAARRSARGGSRRSTLVERGLRRIDGGHDRASTRSPWCSRRGRARRGAPRIDAGAPATGRCAASRSRSRTTSGWPAYRPPTARAALARLRARRRRACGGPAACGRRGHRRQDQQPRVLLPRHHRQTCLRTDPQPARRSTVRRAAPAAGPAPRWRPALTPLGARHGRRRLDPHPRRVLRRGRPQADVRAGAEDARVQRLAVAVGRRTAGHVGARRRARAVGDGRAVPPTIRRSRFRAGDLGRRRDAGGLVAGCGSRCRRTSAGLPGRPGRAGGLPARAGAHRRRRRDAGRGGAGHRRPHRAVEHDRAARGLRLGGAAAGRVGRAGCRPARPRSSRPAPASPPGSTSTRCSERNAYTEVWSTFFDRPTTCC